MKETLIPEAPTIFLPDKNATARIFVITAYIKIVVNKGGHTGQNMILIGNDGLWGQLVERMSDSIGKEKLDELITRADEKALWRYTMNDWSEYASYLRGTGPYSEGGLSYGGRLKGTVSEINAFYQLANMKEILEEIVPEINNSYNVVLPYADCAAKEVTEYLGRSSPNSINLILNMATLLLDNGWAQRQIPMCIHVGVGTSWMDFTSVARHEMTHITLGTDIQMKYLYIISKYSSLFNDVSQEIKWSYSPWSLFVEENLVQAITYRIDSIHNPNQSSSTLILSKDNDLSGFFLVPYFVEKLEEMEASKQSFDSYLPVMLSEIFESFE